nr:unnamed protein product [Callosobruchus analis]
MTLHTVRTVSELLNLSKSIEETAWRVQRFCPPPTNTRQLLEPELAYQVPAQHRRSTLNRPPDVSPLAVDAVSQDGGSSQPLCWNCKSPGQSSVGVPDHGRSSATGVAARMPPRHLVRIAFQKTPPRPGNSRPVAKRVWGKSSHGRNTSNG